MVDYIFYFSLALGTGIHLRSYRVTLITLSLYTFMIIFMLGTVFAAILFRTLASLTKRIRIAHNQ